MGGTTGDPKDLPNSPTPTETTAANLDDMAPGLPGRGGTDGFGGFGQSFLSQGVGHGQANRPGDVFHASSFLAANGLLAGTIFPMNIDPEKWSGLGIDKNSAYDPKTNIKAGVTLIRRIFDRIPNPSPAKIASVWNYVGRENVNDFGAYVGRIYREKPWTK